jgi:hypothetical protein
MYDTRCAITGINVAASEGVMVALDPDGDGFRPITLGLAGAYDGYGTIGDIPEDRNVELIMTYFRDRAQTGDVVFNKDYREYGIPPRDVDSLLKYFERNFCDSSDEHPALALHGRPISYCIISKLVWDAIAEAFAPEEGSADGRFKEVFGGSPIAAAIYQSSLDDVGEGIRAMHAVDRFMRARGIAWSPPDIEMHGAVYDDDENDEFVAAARQQFADVPAIQRALDRHVQEQEALRDDEE